MSVIKNLFNRKARRAGAQEPKSSQSIREEYQSLGYQAGDLALQAVLIQKKITEIQDSMRALGPQMEQALKKEAEAEAEAKSKEAKNNAESTAQKA
jgi:CRISPR/Cas system-associated endonuclease Cas1